MTDYKFTLEYKLDGKTMVTEGKDTPDYSLKEEIGDNKLKITLVPKKKLELVNAFVQADFKYDEKDKFYVNGYQSWTVSREYTKDDVQHGLTGLGASPLGKVFTTLFGDYEFQTYYKTPGIFHSYSYTYIKRNGEIILLGTYSERYGYTIFHADMNVGSISIQKDVEGVTTESEYPLFEVYFVKADYNSAFDSYFAAIGIPKPRFSRMKGYTSWYNYYGGITEKQLLRDLNGLSIIGDKADIFQIDDGYQTAVGDWTLKTDLYPSGMRYIVDTIHEKGYKAGLWMAPFNAARSSLIAKKHPEWLIRNKKGRKEIGSLGWGGAYTIDFMIPEAADYIRGIFKRVFDEWGFDMVKLDFLYSICHTPRNNKSRGQIMTEAMDFLKECVGDHIFLGCGVPLFPAFGVVDFCRISCDVGKPFNAPFLFTHNSNQEFPSTHNAINNSIFRRHLDGRAFGNDPDVFYIRENDLRGKDEYALKSGKLDFTDEQKELLCRINSMFGNVLFVSDNVGGYNHKQMELLLKTFNPPEIEIIDANYLSKSDISVIYLQDGKKYSLDFNIDTGENKTVPLD